MMRRLSRWLPALVRPAAEPPASPARAMMMRLRPARSAREAAEARPRPSSRWGCRALLGLATKAQPWLRGPRSAAGRDYDSSHSV